MKTNRLSLPTLLLPALFLILMRQPAHAGSATWNLNPATGDWNTATNWIPNTVPNGTADIATFGVSNTPNVSLSASVTVDSIVFSPGASAYTIASTSVGNIVLDGAGS